MYPINFSLAKEKKLKIAIFTLLVMWGMGIAQGLTYEYGQLTEDLRGGLGKTSLKWKPNDNEFVSHVQTPVKFGDIFNLTRFENLDLAYGGLLKEVGVGDDPDIANNKVEFLNYLGSLGWELIFFQERQGQTFYYFKKPIIE